MSSVQQPPLTNLQLELLKVFSRSVPDSDLLAIKQLISEYFARKATMLADDIWDSEGFTEQTMQEWRQTHLRTPYQQPKQAPSSSEPS